MKKVGQSGGTTENGRYASGQMYRVPSDETITHCNITRAAIENEQAVEIDFSGMSKKSKSA